MEKTWQRIKNNSKLWEKYFVREKVIQAIREFFLLQQFHEVETPLLVSSVIPESYLDVFATNLKDRLGGNQKLFLTTSPEASIKKLLAAGIGNCFEITKSFRNGETGSKLHNPEFTILEWYRVGATYEDIMKDCEKLVTYINKKLKTKNLRLNEINYQNKIINLTKPWERISIDNALKKFARICLDDITEKNKTDMFPAEKIGKVALRKGYKVEKNNTWEEIFNQIFLNEVEPNLGTHGKPTIIFDYPQPLAALAKLKESDPRLAERFELYMGGLELGDCYTELTDPKEQRKRFKEEMDKIKENGKTPIVPDKDFLNALQVGLPHCSGIAVGVDRLVMLFTDSKTIQETLLFPMSEI